MKKESPYIFIPTDKNSPICLMTDGKMHILSSDINNELYKNHFLYILSDDEIKECDWVIDKHFERSPIKCLNTPDDMIFAGYKKIIATTNPELHGNIDDAPFVGSTIVTAGIPSISQSDIEYIISLYNSKDKEVDELAKKFTDAIWIHCPTAVQLTETVNACVKIALQDNAEKKFTLDDIKKCLNCFTDEAPASYIKREIIKFFTKEQPKSDTVMVEYEFGLTPFGMKEYGKKPIQPKIKDSCIVIIK